ncbi:MAG: hypothetical protein JWQ57_459 [Mucilaginibacter sp.]|nr:hypothetical protein [Mucilaginibacter sp.]
MKNQDKASLPKIQIKQVQVLNRALNANNTIRNGSGGINALMGTTTVETMTTTSSTGF